MPDAETRGIRTTEKNMEIAIILNSGVPVTREITADKVICADGGYLLSPVTPDYLVGDLDSLGTAPEGVPLLKHDSHKNFTDGESAVYFAKELGADLVTLYGVTGGRCDHFLGNLAVMALAMKLGMKVRSFDDDAEIYGVSASLEPHFSHPLKEGETFSIIPHGGPATVTDSKGTEYPLRSLTLTPTDTRGVSNRATADTVSFTVTKGCVFFIRDLYFR